MLVGLASAQFDVTPGQILAILIATGFFSWAEGGWESFMGACTGRLSSC